MARPLRLEYAGALYHITSRGNTRESIFPLTTETEHDSWYFSVMLSRGTAGSVMPTV